ncbi:unnamed protein product [Adineta steineri]|uniref:LRAT domain-containing protein n=1 Tax=Adineta steineri TaxID=433720 RepID=A0A815P078_9BILA|nr:unnamed protein product [Adineta steineri]CAF1128964.1 unnamed protein product [Adineta steineri]CAF1442807.1 unnamed protein product [Adineta steineri]CAF1443337.1 unnamed protein product [Adineta steineri]
MSDYIPRRGDHLYVWRKIRMYQHHGIVVTKEDILNNIISELIPEKLELLMIVEQNIHGLDIVTLKQFRTEHPFSYTHDICCAQYRADPMEYYLNRSGTCYLTKRLPEDKIVENAMRIYNDKHQRDVWKTYSLVLKNCEQFAFICSTSVEYVLGEQVLMGCNVIKCVFINGMYNAAKYIFQIIRQLAEQVMSGIPFETIIKGNGLAALTAFTLEALILTIRLFIYYYYEEDRSKNLTRKYAISPEDYLQEMVQAGFGSLSAFGMSIAGIFVGSVLFSSAMAPMVCSIFFGFIGYITARWITGLIAIKIRKTFSSDNNDKQIMFKNYPGDDDDTVEFA